MNNTVHIVAFDVPSPPTYGGVIDVYYKLKNLFELGMQIHLHLFQYGRLKDQKLNRYCKKVYYYKRNTSFLKALGPLPYIVASRSNKELIQNLIDVDAPIIFEGLHVTYPLKNKGLDSRKTLVRTHNIEHQYYGYTARLESNFIKKTHYYLESLKLKFYEKTLKRCDHILAISQEETKYFAEKYTSKVDYLPAFHKNQSVKELSKKGYFALFHGNLKISDNLKAAKFIIKCFAPLNYPLVIAGQSDDRELLNLIDKYKNINFIELNDFDQLQELLQRAHINIMFSYQPTGLKIKLINALFNSRYVISNNNMTKGSGLDKLCHIADSKKEIQHQVNQLITMDYSKEEIERRKQSLSEFNCKNNARRIVEILQS